MKQLAFFEMYIDHNAIYIKDPEIGEPPDDIEYGNNYEFANGYAYFMTCSNCSHALVEVCLGEEICLREDTRWAVVIPFAVGKSGIDLDSILPEPIQVSVPEGHYALLYEAKLRDKDKVYYKSKWSKVDRRDPDSLSAFCRLTFILQEEVEAKELMRMHWSLRGLKSEAEDIVPFPSD